MDKGVDNPIRYPHLKKMTQKKKALKSFYEDVYASYLECLSNSPNEGIAVELGSGGGFAKEYIPALTTSDIVPYPGLDRLINATSLPFPDESLRAIFLFNVLHHIADAEAFFDEA